MIDTDLDQFIEMDKECHLNPTGVNLKRGAITLKVGNIYTHKSTAKQYLLLEVVDLSLGLFKDLTTLKITLLPISDMDNTHSTNLEQLDVTMISDTNWQTAQNRYMAIEPFIKKVYGTDIPTYQERSDETGVPVRTLKRWVSRYQNNPNLSSLIDRKRGWQLGSRRLSNHQTNIIDSVIHEYYLSPLKPDVSATIRKIRSECIKQNIKPPSANAIRLSIEQIEPVVSLKKRGFKKKAKAMFTPKAGHFPEAPYPLSVVQIDHTPMDIILVDDEHRKPIGRPYLTLAIDVYSRMITGYYISLDAPSATSVGMCLVQSIKTKDELLARFNIDGKWQVFGYPSKIHVDNGADFHASTLEKSCSLHNIDIEFRPLARPEYGGHIERVIGNFMKELHRLDGTTFSNIAKKGEYNSEKMATMTLSEMEHWFLTYITKVYHQKVHSGIGMPPTKKWEIGILGDETTDGYGLPSIPQDTLTLTIDFLPSFERTIQTTGVTIDGIRYYDPVLNNFINDTYTNGMAGKDNVVGKKKKFIFRQDPRDISIIWFFDPITKQYFEIPYASQSLPSMSVWELNLLKKDLKSKNGVVDEHSLSLAYDELKKITEQASLNTKKARRQQARAKHHQDTRSYVNKTKNQSDNQSVNHQAIFYDESDEIKEFYSGTSSLPPTSSALKTGTPNDKLPNNDNFTDWVDEPLYFDDIE